MLHDFSVWPLPDKPAVAGGLGLDAVVGSEVARAPIQKSGVAFDAQPDNAITLRINHESMFTTRIVLQSPSDCQTRDVRTRSDQCINRNSNKANPAAPPQPPRARKGRRGRRSRGSSSTSHS